MGIPVCGECNASAEDGHAQGCSLKGKRPTEILAESHRRAKEAREATHTTDEKLAVLDTLFGRLDLLLDQLEKKEVPQSAFEELANGLNELATLLRETPQEVR